jgi:hypothetical protein
MVEAKFRYEQDLYGKAGWYGKPRGFYVGLGGAYLRTRSVTTAFTAGNWQTFGNGNFAAPAAVMTVDSNRYHDHWLFLIENFVPIIPTASKSLAGTMSFAHQWWVGQGVSAWRLDLPANDRFYRYNGGNAAQFNYDMSFIKRFGGWGQLQYYWTEEIYTNLNAGFQQAFSFNNYQDLGLRNFLPVTNGNIYANPLGYDPIRSAWRVSVTQWYRPVAAVKFALQYAYLRANYFQAASFGTNSTNRGNNHTLFANAWYMF